MHLRVVASATLAMGQGKVAKGMVAKPAKNDMYRKDNVHNTQTNAMHATSHAMNDVKTNQWACLCPMVRRRRGQ